MRFVERRFPTEMERLELLPLSDIHRGHEAFDMQAWERAIKWLLAAENRYCVLNGDAFEAALKNSKGSVYRSLSPGEERRWLREELGKIKHRIICGSRGNHEDRITREVDLDPLGELCIEWDIPYSPAGTFIKLAVGGERGRKDHALVYGVYMLHGFGGGRYVGAALNNVTRLTSVVAADVYVVGHHHKPVVHEDAYLVPDLFNNCLAERQRLYVMAGSFLGQAEYAENKGMTPTSRRFPVVIFDGRQRGVSYTSGP